MAVIGRTAVNEVMESNSNKGGYSSYAERSLRNFSLLLITISVGYNSFYDFY